jgi:hypothetical protein
MLMYFCKVSKVRYFHRNWLGQLFLPIPLLHCASQFSRDGVAWKWLLMFLGSGNRKIKLGICSWFVVTLCIVLFCFAFEWDWGLKSRLCACKPGTLLLEPHFQSILLQLFWRWGLTNYLPRLALNSDHPDLSLQSSWITGASHWYLACMVHCC